MDTRNLRLTRLSLLSKHLIHYTEELALEKDTIDWAINSYNRFKELLSQQSKDLEEKSKYYAYSQEADMELYERYVVLKELLLTRYNKNQYAEYGILGAIPSNREDRYDKAIRLIEAHQRLKKSGDKNILPQEMIDKLHNLCTQAKEQFDIVLNIKNKSVQSTKKVNETFDLDSLKIRKLYNWIAACWGKKDARMLTFGFSLPKSISNTKKTPTIFQLKVDKNNKKISWHLNGEKKSFQNSNLLNNNDEEIKSVYQLAFKNNLTNTEWYEIYSGDELKDLDLIDEGIYKIRARNNFGYGPWSPEIKL